MRFLPCLFAILVLTMPAAAETPSSPKHRVTLYFLGAGLTGQVGMAGWSTDIDLSLSEILENLDFGFMGAYRFHQDSWSVGTDVIYLGLGSKNERPGTAQTELTIDQWMVELSGGYRVRPFLTLIGGGHYNSLSNRVTSTATSREINATENWIDPFLGGWLTFTPGSGWVVHLRADAGGFGLGSDFAWQVMPALEWTAVERVSVLLAYRVIGIDYENEDNGFEYDVVISGPALGLSGRF